MQDRDDPPGRPTLRTIAEMTGLSLSTVSLSLRGGASLKQETRDKVAEAARKVGYVPDRAKHRVESLFGATLAVLRRAEEHGISPAHAADHLAEERIAAVGSNHPYLPRR